MKRKPLAIVALAGTVAVGAGISISGCGDLMSLAGAIALDLLGVTPASDFRQTGNLHFSVLADDEDKDLFGSLADSMTVEVENDDGTYSDCEYVDEDSVDASMFNSIALVIDDSGSMERAYPQDEYGDACLTCPHDPERVRADAARELIQVVSEQAPYSRIAVMDFGPVVDEGKDATHVLADFGTETDAIVAALEGVDGTQLAPTPMWDSLAEIVVALGEDADAYEVMLRTSGLNPDEDDPETVSVEPDIEPGEPVEEPAEDPVTDDPTDQPTFEPEDVTPGEPIEDAEVLRYVVVISDGDDRHSDTYTLDSLIALALDRGVVIHAIGLGPASATNESPLLNSDEQVSAVTNLQRLAEETGGFYAPADDPEALVELYNHIATSLAEGYDTTTFACVPDQGEGPIVADPEDENPVVGPSDDSDVPMIAAGQRVRGRVRLGNSGIAIPWSVIAP